MKLTALVLSFFTIIFFMNCGQDANFDDGSQFKSLVDGESIEVVSNEELDAIENEGDSGLVSDDDGSSEDDGGLHSDDDDDDDSYERQGNRAHRYSGVDYNHGHKGCKDRIIEQHSHGRHHEMVTSPEEMENDEDMNEATSCGSKGHKVLVCHFPNAEYAKRKTLCIGRPALEAHIAHLGGKRGSDHVDYAGACRDLEGNIADGDHSDNDSEDEGETSSADFSGRR